MKFGKIPAPKDKCTGCGVCMAVCPTGAVSMDADTVKGFLYPNLNISKCIRCGKCARVCPVYNSPPEKDSHEYPDVYAANSLLESIRYKSASGGLFFTLATGILRRGGSAAGVIFSGRDTCRHVLAETEDELIPLLGTKYFQSNMSSIYEKIFNWIKSTDKDVLFCGTPCQVHAVKNYAYVMGISSRLICVDLLCRGIPSPFVYKAYVNLIEKESGKKISHIQMKEKTRGWDKIGTMITFEDGHTEYDAKEKSLFIKSFIETNLSVRDSCFGCRYKTIHREGDITIADFWGLKNNHLLDNKGTSLVILNTKKGRKLFKEVKDTLDYIPSTMWRVYMGNFAAFHKISCSMPAREQFFELLYEGKDLREAVNESLYSKQQI